MNKRAMACAIAASLIGGLSASTQDVKSDKIETQPEKVLIACYSWGGNTRAAAEMIQQATGGTLFEIKPVKPYPSDYRKCTEVARADISAGIRPELAAKIDDIAKYDVIFVGSPNWWGTMAPPVATFLTAHDLKGKTVIPFFTHGGGGMQRCETDVRKLCPESNVLTAATFSGGSIRSAQDTIRKWLDEVVSIKPAALSAKERNIAAISMYTAHGDMEKLKAALNAGLDAGLTVNEIKEILVQLYAYCGFPRSLNALNNFMALVREREARGLKDVPGKLPGPLPAGDSVAFGGANQTKLCGGEIKGPVYEFAPAIDRFLKGHLFGDIFGRDNLDWKTRELATVAALAAMDGTERQRDSHIRIGKHNGLAGAQIAEVLKMASPLKRKDVFPQGTKIESATFNGDAWLAPLVDNRNADLAVSNVTFAPGVRNNWHTHSIGQILLCTSGAGYYQERGKAARRLLPGDVVDIPAGAEHWHGAAPDSEFSHIAVMPKRSENKTVWAAPVSAEEYAAAAGK
ncbi:MAG: cupin domain-containing protein [Lentisphaeria bacterium]|nr:cupin domain-containing protein [Lentisphaeria bacterium]